MSKHTARLGTPLYRLKTCSARVKLATHLAMKGMSIADISEVLGHSETTVARWLDRGGVHSDRLHERDFTGLRCGHIQLDELVGKVRQWGQRVWVWVAQDVASRAWLKPDLFHFPWLPSHMGGLAVALHPQKNTFFDSVASNFNGVNSVPECEPSQNGCLLLRPQLHQK